MSFTSALLGIGEKIQKVLPGTNRPEKSALGRVAGFFGEVGKTLTSRGLSPLERDAQEQEDKLTKAKTPQFIEEATALKTNYDSLAIDRQKEVERLKVKSGAGTNLIGESALGKQVPILPKAPTAQDLARSQSKKEIVDEILRLQEEQRMPDRSKTGTLAKSVLRGATFGITGNVDPNNPLTIAQNIRKPMSTAEKVVNVGAEIGSSFAPYGVIARTVGGALTSAGALRSVAVKHPLLFRSVVENFGQEAVEMGVRKGTGQEYTPQNFVIGMALGGAFELGAFANAARKGVAYAPYKELEIQEAIQSHLNTATDTLMKTLGRTPTPKEVYDAVQNDPVPMIPAMTFKGAYGESRLAYYRQNMREGIDVPGGAARGEPGLEQVGMGESRMPGLSGDERITAKNIAKRTISGDLTPKEGVEAMDGIMKAYKPVKTDAEAEEVFFDPTAWDHFKDIAGKMLNSRYLERFGDEGKSIAHLIDQADQDSAIKIGNNLLQGAPIMKSLDDAEAQNAADVAEGLAQPVNEKVAAFMNWWNVVRQDIGKRAEDAGIEITLPDGTKVPFRQRDNYIPRVINRDKLKSFLAQFNKTPVDQRNKFFENIMENSRDVATGELRIKTVTEAKRLWNEIISKTGQTKYGHLERARSESFLPKEVLEQISDRDVRQIIPGYVVAAERRIADAKLFGPNQEKINELVETARLKGQDADTMLELVNRVTGREAATQRGQFSPSVSAVSKAVRTYQTITKMSLSALSNIGDVVKPFVRTGEFIPAMRGIIRSFTKEGADQAVRSGVVENNLRALAEEVGDTGFAETFLKWTGFQMTESKIRAINANAAIAHAEILVKRMKGNADNVFGYRRLAQYLDNPDAAIQRGYLTQAEKDIIGFQGIADTQPLRRLDLPHYWQTPTGRVMTQFKSFAYKQMTFTKKFIIDEAKQGNVRPLLMFLVMGQMVGEPVGDLKAWARGRSRDDSIGRRVIDNYMTIGGVGLATDFLSNIQYGSMGGGFLKFVAGPTLGEIGDVLERAASPNRVERLSKKALYTIPVVGPAAANYAFPAKQTYRARTMPILEDILQLTEGSSGGSSTRTSRSRSRPSRTRSRR